MKKSSSNTIKANTTTQTKAVTSISPLKKKNNWIVFDKVQLKKRNVPVSVGATQSKKGKTTDQSNDELLGLDDVGLMEELDKMRQ